MPDIIDSDGLQVSTRTELRTALVDGLKAIYGSDITVDSNSPDGQLIDLFVQSGIDIREIAQYIYNSFSIKSAEGKNLDSAGAIIGIQRNQGSYTTFDLPITVDTDKRVDLVGLDSEALVLEPTNPDVYTIKDEAGNKYYLSSSIDNDYPTTPTSPITGIFRAAAIGTVSLTASTVFTPITVIRGVQSLGGGSDITTATIGEPYQSDYSFRRQLYRSRAIGSNGYLESVVSALRNLSDVTFANVEENNYSEPTASGIPGHSIYAIVDGGDDTEICDAIYKTKSAGCGTYGSTTADLSGSLPRPWMTPPVIYFDRPVVQNIIVGVELINSTEPDSMEASIINGVKYDPGITAYADDIVEYLKDNFTGLNIGKVVFNIPGETTEASDPSYYSPTSIRHKLTITEVQTL